MSNNSIEINAVLEVIKAIALEIPEPTFAADHYTALALRAQLVQATLMAGLIQELREMQNPNKESSKPN